MNFSLIMIEMIQLVMITKSKHRKSFRENEMRKKRQFSYSLINLVLWAISLYQLNNWTTDEESLKCWEKQSCTINEFKLFSLLFQCLPVNVAAGDNILSMSFHETEAFYALKVEQLYLLCKTISIVKSFLIWKDAMKIHTQNVIQYKYVYRYCCYLYRWCSLGTDVQYCCSHFRIHACNTQRRK